MFSSERQPYSNIYFIFRFDLMMMLKIDSQCWCGYWRWSMVLCNWFVEFFKSDIAVQQIKKRNLAPSPYWMVLSLLRILCINKHSIDVKIITLLIWLHWGHFFTSLFLPTYWWMVIKLVSCIFRATAGYWLHFPLDLHSTHSVTSDPDSLPLFRG